MSLGNISNRAWAFAKPNALALHAVIGLLGLTGSRAASAVSDPHGILGTGASPAAREPEDATPATSTAELQHTLPDLKLREAPPSALFSAQFGMHIPYQVLGVGAGLELHPTRWLRFDALYSFGFSPIENGASISHYGEASLGVAVYGRTSDTVVELTTRAIPYADPVTLKAFVPSYHALFVEGGAITGFFSPARCTANCAAEGGAKTLVADSRQFVMPFAGLRYVSYYSAASEHAGFQRRVYMQVYAHAFGKPFNSPDHPIYDYKGEVLARDALGGRIGIDLPPPNFCIADAVLHTGCGQGGLAIGYNPTPGFVFFEFHISYVID